MSNPQDPRPVTVSSEDDVRYETIRGVTVPIEPGSSRLRIEVERRKAKKRMREDDRKLARIEANLRAMKANQK